MHEFDLPQDDPELTCMKPSPHSPLCRQPKIAALIPIRLCHVIGWNFTYLNILSLKKVQY